MIRRPTSTCPARSSCGRRRDRRAERLADVEKLTPGQLLAKIQKLERRMYQHAPDLEFEEAARLRDEIAALRRDGLLLPEQIEDSHEAIESEAAK